MAQGSRPCLELPDSFAVETPGSETDFLPTWCSGEGMPFYLSDSELQSLRLFPACPGPHS